MYRFIAAIVLVLTSLPSYPEESTVKLRQLNLSDAIIILDDGKEFNIDRNLLKKIYEDGEGKVANSLAGKYVTITWKHDQSADTGRLITELKSLLGSKKYGHKE